MLRTRPHFLLVFALVAAMAALAAGCVDDKAANTAGEDSQGDSKAGSDGTTGSGGDSGGDSGADAPDGGGVSVLSPPAGGYAAVFLDVGQGDATLIIASTGEVALIDGGIGAGTLGKRLSRLGLKRLDIVIATHADADHITGLTRAFENFAVTEVWWNGVTKGSQIFDSFLEAAQKEPGATVHIARHGDHIKLGNLDLEVLHPGDGADTSSDHNNQSVVIQTGCAGGWLLMPGDAEKPAEDEMFAAGGLSDVDVLHVAHHGSDSGTTAALLALVKPEHAIISAGLTNAYGHPDKSVVDRLEGIGAKIWRTDLGWDDDSLWMHADCKGGLVFGRVP